MKPAFVVLLGTLLLGQGLQSSFQAAAQEGPSSAAAQAGTPVEGDVENGQQLMRTYGCYACHGYSGEAGPGGRLATNPRPFPDFVRYVRAPRGSMPAYRSRISEADLADIYAFLKSVPPRVNPDTIPLLNDEP